MRCIMVKENKEQTLSVEALAELTGKKEEPTQEKSFQRVQMYKGHSNPEWLGVLPENIDDYLAKGWSIA
jgi:hypothetical protein